MTPLLASSSRAPGVVHQLLASHSLGGADFIAVELARMVAARGARSAAWVPDSGLASEALHASDIASRRYSLSGLGGGRVRRAAALASFGARLGVLRPSILHVHHAAVYGLLSPVLRLAATRSIAHFHLYPTDEDVRWALRHPPSLVIACSEHIAQTVRRVADAHRPGVSVVAVPNAVDVEKFYPADRQLSKVRVGAPVNRPLLLMLANFSPHKGHATTLRAVRHLAADGISVEVWFAGDERGGGTNFVRDLKQLAEELGLSSIVKWLGYRPDGPDLLRAADFLLLPSTQEGLSLSVLEAQASEVLVVGSPIPGIAEAVEDGQTGFLVPHDDPAGFAARIKLALERPDVAADIRIAARQRVHLKHSWTAYLDRIWRLYEGLGARTQPPARPMYT